MGLSKKILNIALSIVNVLTFWIKPQKGRITFISLTSDHLEGDFLAIDTQLKKRSGFDIHYNLIVYDNSLKSKAAYFFNCLKQLVEMKKSSLVILNDNNYVVSNFKPKGLKVLQIWHASGAIKKFGNQIKRRYPISGYDAVISSGPYWKKPFAEAFGVKEEQVFPTGLARDDDLLDQKKQEKEIVKFLKKFPELKDKKTIFYAPTFRGNIIDGLKLDLFDFDALMEKLPEEYALVYKLHPLLKNNTVPSKKAVNASDENLNMLLSLADLLITDYSSIAFDYALLNKPVVFYMDDLESYKKSIGLNIDPKDLYGPVIEKEEELAEAILEEMKDIKDHTAFCESYICHHDEKNTERIADLIQNIVYE